MQYSISAVDVNGILTPSPTGNIVVLISEQIEVDGTKTASVSFHGTIQGFVTYGINGNKAVSCTQLGINHNPAVEQSLLNIMQSMR